jgi:hypothetical protein
MKKIKLTKGGDVLVDDEDFEELNKYKWYAFRGGKTFYATRMERLPDKKWKMTRMHREIMGARDGVIIDHINANGLDNRKENLRFCTRKENNRNSSKQKNNKSGFKGVCWYKRCSKWHARIMVDGKNIDLGLFSDVKEAAKAYNIAAMEHYGEFARLNDI